MTYHIVMWKFKDEIKAEERPRLAKEMEKNLTGLLGGIEGLKSVHFVTSPIPSSTHDVALITEFEKPEDIAAYAVHPEHVKVADTFVRPYVKDRACLDYQA